MQEEPEKDSFYRSIAQSREQLRIEEEQKRKAIQKDLLIRGETFSALKKVAFATGDYPVHELAEFWLHSDWKKWAAAIVEAAKAWKVHPGERELDEKPLPDKSLGFKVAKRIFDRAIAGTTVEEVYEELLQARETLKPWKEGFSNDAGSVFDLLAFFQQLLRFYGRDGWNPPISEFNPRKKIKNNVGEQKRKRRPTWMTMHQFSKEFRVPYQTVYDHRKKLNLKDFRKESNQVLIRTSAVISSLKKAGHNLPS